MHKLIPLFLTLNMQRRKLLCSVYWGHSLRFQLNTKQKCVSEFLLVESLSQLKPAQISAEVVRAC